ncbi:hypothetical protein MAL08_19690 (plasmid) [Leptospira noguchii]|uniref:hypothetical protein n=1 Tax=Leptospira noguchii TaxID=28182 RepID=UPI001FB5BAEC|nr:hypothetical protein [Leptospira noguchii]UOG39970.1 hypothetical protein MAL08_19690 [Leptospira noguchii]
MTIFKNSVLFVLVTCSIYCSNSNHLKAIKFDFPTTDQELYQSLISVESWENEKGTSIIFRKDNTFEYVQVSEPVVTGTGKYQVINKQVKLRFGKQENHTWLNGKSIVCDFTFKSHPWRPQQYISCVQGKNDGKFELANPKSINIGDEDYIDKIKVQIVGYKPANTTRSLYIRNLPSLSGKIIPFSELGSEECLDEYYLFRSGEKPEKVNPDLYIRFPAKFDLTVIAETKDKYTVDKFENHWYFVKIFVSCIGYDTTRYGWIYGEFINSK